MEVEKEDDPSGLPFHRGLLRNQYWTFIVHAPTLYEIPTGAWLLAYQHLTIDCLYFTDKEGL
ncbi:hypothetical protein M430DRAFT_37439 [Amorphotheca resinae ATCC 22711]|uniref:Uncharacterized protein n=1 Tax=Amorphotheca resinae ATCC 22711 TaxID=857342 RepID=A0A2T3AQU7_AMORE|nr:hypothetical protein M430DRAFT_37439 [Amorphotheca resinae ATCC 22711]PSS08645.1 hypothetical protein M430DRAFT_37439 [Amorphotheca resinae ATCC 22711]